MPYITRYAPSPTGLHHLGGLRTAYLNFLAAKASNGKWILRLDDTDLDRNKEEYTKVILDSLKWVGLTPDELFYQSKRTDLYIREAQSLLKQGKAKELSNGAISLLWPEGMPTSFKDSISGDIFISQTNKDQIHERLILVRGGDKIGLPTYQFCSAVDDYHMGINFILRGHDHISNSPKQIAIWKALNSDFEIPKMAHVGLIHKDKKKLSKREDAASLLWYKDNGYKPEAILNFVLRMGWGPHKDNKENSILSMDRAISIFFEGNLKASPSNYDENKLNWYNKIYEQRKKEI